VPLWIGNASLRLVATRELGDLGTSESEPVVIQWRWYYHLPSMAIWIMVAGLLVLVRENRNWQAATILVPAVLLAGIAWPLLANWVPRPLFILFCFVPCDDEAEFAFSSLIGTWTALWLMAPWLARRRVSTAIGCFVAFLLVFGVANQLIAFCGVLSVSPSALLWLLTRVWGIWWYATTATAMLLGLVFGAVACRKRLPLRRVMLWGFLGMLLATFVGVSAEACMVYVTDVIEGNDRGILFFILGPIFASLGIAVFVFLVSLPFLYLARRVPCYRDRLRDLLRLPDRGTP
jgi:hypothetical protein